MKAFKDLEKGDDLFIVTVESEIFKISPKISKVSSVLLKDKLEGATVLFDNDGSEMAIIVDPNSSKHCNEYRPALREIWYFADRYSLECFIKQRCEKLRSAIGKFEELYNSIWNIDIAEKTKLEKLTSIKGTFIKLAPFKKPAICDGEGIIYFSDGYPLKIDVFKSIKDKDISVPTEDEIKRFLADCSYRTENQEKPGDKERIISSLRNCGYVFNYIFKEFTKI